MSGIRQQALNNKKLNGLVYGTIPVEESKPSDYPVMLEAAALDFGGNFAGNKELESGFNAFAKDLEKETGQKISLETLMAAKNNQMGS